MRIAFDLCSHDEAVPNSVLDRVYAGEDEAALIGDPESGRVPEAERAHNSFGGGTAPNTEPSAHRPTYHDRI